MSQSVKSLLTILVQSANQSVNRYALQVLRRDQTNCHQHNLLLFVLILPHAAPQVVGERAFHYRRELMRGRLYYHTSPPARGRNSPRPPRFSNQTPYNPVSSCFVRHGVHNPVACTTHVVEVDRRWTAKHRLHQLPVALEHSGGRVVDTGEHFDAYRTPFVGFHSTCLRSSAKLARWYYW